MRRVVVSGMGAVTALGGSLSATCAALRRGARAIAAPTRPELAGSGARLVAEVTAFEPRTHFRVPKALKLTNRPTQFAVAAATMALQDGRWPAEGLELGVVIGTSGFDPAVGDLVQAVGRDPDRRALTDMPFFAERMLSRLNPLWLLVGLPNMASSHVAMQLQAHGPNSSIMNDWVAGLQAIGEASDWIRHGEATAVLAGGADSALFPHACASYAQAGLLDDDGSGRQAFIPGEGAAVVLLEERDHALGRQVPIHGEIVAHASSSLAPAARHTSRPSGLDVTLKTVLRETGWEPASIQAIGSSVVPSDELVEWESAALARTLGDAANGIPRSTHADRLGHPLAAGGAIETVLLLSRRQTEATCRILVNALGFSGQAVTLAMAAGAGRGYDERPE